jgi:hypothetical protein
MMRFFRLSLMAALVGVAILAAPSAARADLQIRFSTDGGSTFSVPVTSSTNPGMVSVTVDGLTFSGTGNSNLTTGSSTLDLSAGGTLLAGNYNGSHSIVIQLTVTSVPTQPPPQTLSGNITGSILNDPSHQLTQTGQGWISTSNAAFNTTTGIVANTGVLPIPTAAIGPISFSTSSAYSWTLQYTISGNYTGVGASVSSDHNEQIVAGSAPASLVLLLTGMPVVSLGAWRRRQRALTA